MYRPPKAVARAAKRGLRLREKWGRGGTRVGMARARQLSKRENVSMDTIRRMVSFFARHEKNKDTPPEEGNGMIAWLLWGGDPGREWAESVMDMEENPMVEKSRLLREILMDFLGQFHPTFPVDSEDDAEILMAYIEAIRPIIEDSGQDLDALQEKAEEKADEADLELFPPEEWEAIWLSESVDWAAVEGQLDGASRHQKADYISHMLDWFPGYADDIEGEAWEAYEAINRE